MCKSLVMRSACHERPRVSPSSCVCSSGLFLWIYTSLFIRVYRSLWTCFACHARPHVSPSWDILISFFLSIYIYMSLFIHVCRSPLILHVTRGHSCRPPAVFIIGALFWWINMSCSIHVCRSLFTYFPCHTRPHVTPPYCILSSGLFTCKYVSFYTWI